MPAHGAAADGIVLDAVGQGVIGPQADVFDFVLPAGTWRLLWAQNVFTSDATVATRLMRCQVLDDTGVSLWLLGDSAQVAGFTFFHMYAPTIGNFTTAFIGTHFPIPGTILKSGWTLRIGNIGGGVGAGDSQIVTFEFQSV